ncbi:MAG: hypothetical protein DI534_09745 [Leifsonia xyli]|nr:MAG: hypothetical protein DI534_09745 [Leifsonia xyli]
MGHGAEGEAPDRWLHAGIDTEWPGIGYGQILREGVSPAEYFLHLSLDVAVGPIEARELASRLRVIAARLENRAGDLPTF